jgi:hypothetical protein
MVPTTNDDIFVVGLCGFAGSGKDTLADFLVDNYGFEKFSFSDALKDVLATLFDWDRRLLEGDGLESRRWRETSDESWSKELEITNFTPRKAMQQIGTGVFREHFHENIWALILKNKILKSRVNKIVITDCRFINEFETLSTHFKYFYVFSIIREIPDAGEGWYDELKNNVKTDEDYLRFKSKMTTPSFFSPFYLHESEYEWIRAIEKFGVKSFSFYNTFERVEDFKEFLKTKIRMISNDFRIMNPLHPFPLAFFTN